MQRRDFLRMVGAASIAPGALEVRSASAAPGTTVTVLYDDRAVALDKVRRDPKNLIEALWVRKSDLPRINGFEVKPQGACRADICIPISKDMKRGDYFNVTAFAKKIGQSVVAEPESNVWSLGEIQALGGGLSTRIAPDFTVPNRAGRPLHLHDFRGQKVLVVTWASW
jgi:hypothetical protein